MLELLSISDIYLKSGNISSVRLSTRPDAISEEILDVLKAHGVKTIELGLQSFSDNVLKASNRGHTSLDSEKACKMIKSRGFDLIGQMMVGLPSSTLSDELYTSQKICDLGCDGARVYPTVVFPDTELDRMERAGVYKKLTLDEAVSRTAEVLEIFVSREVPVIRIGLCANETLSDERYGDNYHPSVGELSINRLYLKKMSSLLTAIPETENKTVLFTVANGKISQAVGQKKMNVSALKEAFKLKNIKFGEDRGLRPFDISVTVLNT
jgi:histone acetyltransferase (RNA polymerase elongator complex component)